MSHFKEPNLTIFDRKIPANRSDRAPGESLRSLGYTAKPREKQSRKTLTSECVETKAKEINAKRHSWKAVGVEASLNNWQRHKMFNSHRYKFYLIDE